MNTSLREPKFQFFLHIENAEKRRTAEKREKEDMRRRGDRDKYFIHGKCGIVSNDTFSREKY